MLDKTKNQVNIKEKNQQKQFLKSIKISKNDLLFGILITITSIAGIVISIKSKQYNEFLRRKNPNYYFPTIAEITYKTTILTIILLIPKVLIEKALFPFTEKILIDKYTKKEYKHEKIKAKRKMAIYGLKFFHYLIISINSYFVFDKLDFFPKELFFHGDQSSIYNKGLDGFSFFKRPYLFDFHYLLDLAYTFADFICVVFIYDGQTDIMVMIFHHLCTINLILFSYYNHFDGLGAITLFLHNVTDVIVYLARTMLYVVAPDFIKIIITVCLLTSFIYCRLFVYGKLCYLFFKNATWESFGIIQAFKFQITCLYILHCTWTYKLLQIVYNAITSSSFSDSREFIKEKKKVN